MERRFVLLTTIVVCHTVVAHIPVPQPVFRSTARNFKKYENDSLTLPCLIDNLGVNIVRWWKGSILLTDSSDPGLMPPDRITVWDNNTLQLEDLSRNDTGEYTCQVVRQEPWDPLEQVHSLEVLYPPEVTTIPPSGYVEVRLGEEVEMGCRVVGVPPPVVTWKTKGEVMQLIDNRHFLRFKADNRLMAGVYQCIADNGVGQQVVDNIRLRVLYKPEVTPERAWVHASTGVRVELQCRVAADPEPTVKWLFEGAPLELGSSRIVQYKLDDKNVLLFRNVRVTDFGEYKCVAGNELGETSQVLQISGIANPAIFKKEGKRPTPDSFTLIWEVDSYSPIIEYNLLFREHKDPPTGEWVKLVIPADGYSPGPLHSKSYTMTGLQSASVYQAMLLSRNKYGWSKPSQIYKFATEGAEMEEEEIPTEVETEVEANLISEVSSILRMETKYSGGSSLRFDTTCFIVALTFFVINSNL